MGRLIAVSNRTAADPGARAGGLAVAVWESLRSSGGKWFGWSGDIVPSDHGPPRRIEDEGVEFVVTDLTEEEHDKFYLHYANRVLWPVFHYRLDLASFDHDSFLTYASVNRRFAKMIAPSIEPGDTIWVHDYHFLLLGEALREQGCKAPIGFFLHIPFPAPEMFRALPEREWIARAMSRYDVIGFQSANDRANFVRYLIEDCGGKVQDGDVVMAFGHEVKAAVYPIGIDSEALREASTSPEAQHAAQRIERYLNERQLVLGVDRMDYSKGLPERFLAVGKLFDNYPDVRGRVSVTQIAPPSRSKVREYRELREQLDRLAGRINGDHGDLDWIPLRYLARSYGRAELAGLFRVADVCLVTPLHDGMNLVCKEFVMAQNPDDPGVLILSEFAGAAEQLHAALMVNPHDVDSVAETLHLALNMPLQERIDRWKLLEEVVTGQNIDWWRENFLMDLNAVKNG